MHLGAVVLHSIHDIIVPPATVAGRAVLYCDGRRRRSLEYLKPENSEWRVKCGVSLSDWWDKLNKQ